MSVVVVICGSCAGDGVCKSFFAKLFLLKRIFQRFNSFPAPQYGFHNLLNVILSDLSKLSLSFKTKTEL